MKLNPAMAAAAAAIFVIIFSLVLGALLSTFIIGEEPTLLGTLAIFGFLAFSLAELVLVPYKVYLVVLAYEKNAAVRIALPPTDAAVLPVRAEDSGNFKNYVPLKPDLPPAARLALISAMVLPMAIGIGVLEYKGYEFGRPGFEFILWIAFFGGFLIYLIFLLLQILLLGKTTLLVSTDKVSPGDYFSAVIYQSGHYRIDHLEVSLEMHLNYFHSEDGPAIKSSTPFMY